MLEPSDNGNSEDNSSSEKNLAVLEEMINRVQAIFEKLKVNIEEADLNPKLESNKPGLRRELIRPRCAQV